MSPVPWEAGPELTDAERAAIIPSIQIFQLGESSEGRNLYHRAREYSERENDSDYAPAIRLFIMEEQRHAAVLGRFLQLNNIPLLQKSFTDSVFRKLRRFARLELSICVLITAEKIAKVYYVALRDSTRSKILRAICEQILRDEFQHVRFQSQRIALLRGHRSRISQHAREFLQRILFFGTTLIVWLGHRRAFRAGGFSFANFWRQSWCEFSDALEQMDPRRYPSLHPATSNHLSSTVASEAAAEVHA